MTLLYADSFDYYNTNQIDDRGWTGLAAMAIQTGGRHGSNRLQGGVHFNGTSPSFTGSQTIIYGAATMFLLISQDTLFSFPGLISATGTELTLSLNDSKQLEIRIGTQGGTPLANGTKVLVEDVWYYIEMKAYIHDSAGTVVVKLDGVTEINYGPGDTSYNGDTSITNISLARAGSGGIYPEMAFDDLYICNDQGSTCNDFLGDVRIDCLRPNGAGNSTDFTASTGSNYQCVDDTTPNDDTDYVYGSTVGDHDTYAMEDHPSAAGSIYATQSHAWMAKESGGTRQAKIITRSGSTDYEGSAESISDTYQWFSEIREVDPDTSSAWTISGFNAAQFGTKIEA